MSLTTIKTKVYAEGLGEDGKWREIATSEVTAPTINWHVLVGKFKKGRFRRITEEILEIDILPLEETEGYKAQ